MTRWLSALALVEWRIKDFAEGEGTASRAFDAALDDGSWIDVSVPGDVYLALHAAGRVCGELLILPECTVDVQACESFVHG